MLLHPMFDAFLGCGAPAMRAACGRGWRCGRAEDIEESDAGWLVRVQLPGKAPQDVTVEVVQPAADGEPSSLLIHANPTYQGRFALPEDADARAVSASLVDGVLTVAVPRTPAPAPVEVDVYDAPAPAVDAAAADAPKVITVPCAGFSAAQVGVAVHLEAGGGGGHVEVTARAAGGGPAAATRRFALPRRFSGDAAAVAAFCQHGLLSIHVPRAAAPGPAEVPVADVAAEQGPDEAVVLRAPVPGLSAAQLSARVADGGRTVVVEAAQGSSAGRRAAFVAAALPRGTPPAGLRAAVKDGLLTVLAPKAPAPATLTVPLDTAAAAALPAAPMATDEPAPDH